MKKFLTGYFLTLDSGKFSAKKYSGEAIEKPELKLVPDNYKGYDYEITWEYNSHWHGLEFIICAEKSEIAQNVLFNVFCAESLFEGTGSGIEPFSPLDYGADLSTLQSPLKQVRGFSSRSIPYYFSIAAKASMNIKWLNSIVKYQLSTEIYSKNFMDLHEVIDWKTTDYTYIQMRFAYAIVTAYAVIEELGLEVIISNGEKSSKLANGDWNPVVLNDLMTRLTASNVDTEEYISWMIRGNETEIEKNRPIKTYKRTEWADPEGYENDFFITIKDGYVSIPDAINYISYLRSRIASHSVGKRIMQLSVFDVANAQFLARKLILESMKLRYKLF